jgi:hypothetical protein
MKVLNPMAVGLLAACACASARPAPAKEASPNVVAVAPPDTREKPPSPPPLPGGPTTAGQKAALETAKASFQAFLARAGTRPEYAEAAEEARLRIEDIDRILIFLGDGKAPSAR